MPEKDVIVRCNHCLHMMREDEHDDACPRCGKNDAMMAMDVDTIILQNNASLKPLLFPQLMKHQNKSMPE